MGYVVKMPKLGLEMEQGTLLEWHVAEGDAVEEGETLAEVESEKSIGEVDAREDGVLRLIGVEEGETVPPGTPIGILAGPDEDIAELETEFDAEAPTTDAGADEETTASADAAERGATETGSRSASDASEVKASPKAERRAEDLGVDLSEVTGSGPQGAVTADDVEAAAETDSDAETASEQIRASPRAERRAEELGVDLGGIDGSGPQGAITADDVEAAHAAETTETDATDEAELHPEAEDLLHELSEAGVPPLYRLSTSEARETFRNLTVPEGDPEPIDRVVETEIAGPNGPVPVRLYVPRVAEGSAEGPRPTLVFFHGGGWVVGDLSTHDLACRALANAADCVVASVAYRRAPENPFPAALEDCYAATASLAKRPEFDGVTVDPTRLAVGGDSSGGTLAAGVSLLSRDRDGPRIVHQVLVYPATNNQFDTESYTENAKGYFITRDDMERFWDAYLETPGDGHHPYAAPLRATDLTGLPSATVLTAGFDPLRDEGRAYADRLAEAGVPVTRLEYDDMIHGFLTMLEDPEWDRAREAVADLAGELRTAFERANGG